MSIQPKVAPKPESQIPLFSRRAALKQLGCGFGYLAFAGLANQAAAREEVARGGLSPKAPHFPPRAKRVIFLCMNGGPSHVDLFDPKPALNKKSGKDSPVGKDNYGAQLLGCPFKFSQHGKSGLAISEVFPELAKLADE